MSYKKYLSILAVPVFCIYLMTSGRAAAAGVPFTWNSYGTTIQKGGAITLTATFVNNTGAPIVGNRCALRAAFEKDTSVKMGGPLISVVSNSQTDSASSLTYGSTKLSNPGVTHGTTYSINYDYSPGYSVPSGGSATLVAKAKLWENNKFANPGDVILAYFDCSNDSSNQAVNIPRTASPARITVVGPTPATQVPSSASQSKPTTQTQPAVVAAPAAPSLASVKVGGKDAPIDQPLEFAEGHPVVLSGVTTPRATVTVYLFSDPQIFTTTADENGQWSYTLVNVPSGDHHVEAEVTDPTTKKTSERKQLLAFTVKAANVAQSSTSTNETNSPVAAAWQTPLLVIPFIPLWLLICLVISRSSGWATLAKVYRYQGVVSVVGVKHWQSGRVGSVRCNNILNIGFTNDGMYMSLAKLFAFQQPPLLIPWSKITFGEKKVFSSRLVIEAENSKSITVWLPWKLAEEAKNLSRTTIV